MSISAVILTKNNTATIANQIKQLRWCDEVVVIDDNSMSTKGGPASGWDKKVKFYTRSLNDDFAAQRNFGLTKATSDWVLFIDSDEYVSDKLAQEIQKSIKNTQYQGFFIPRVDYWQGKRLSHGEFHIPLIRLGKKNAGKWERKVHEVWTINNCGRLQNCINHYPHPTVREFVAEVNYYSSLHAKMKKKATFWHVIFYPILKFINNFIFRQGFLDGTHGFVAAVMMSFHSYLGWSKAWKH